MSALSRGVVVVVVLVVAIAAQAAPPVLTDVTPDAVVAGSPGFTITVDGTNFVNGSRIRFGTFDRTTTFVSSTRLTAQILSSDISSQKTVNITVVGTNGTSSAIQFLVLPNEPTIAGIAPTEVAVGSSAFTLRVTGQNFSQTAVVRVNQSARPTTWIDTSTLDAQIPASDLTSQRELRITVLNHNGRESAVARLNVTFSAVQPEITAISPTRVQAGGQAFTLRITGRNFHRNAVVRIGGTQRTPTFIDPQTLDVAVTRTMIATAGNLEVVVVNPQNQVSAAATLVVESGRTPTINNITPASLTVNTRNLQIVVEGTNFEFGAQVRVNGAARTTVFNSANRLTATLQTTDVTSERELVITVANPTATGGVSAPRSIFVTGLNAATIANVTPRSITVGTANQRIVVTGTNFLNTDNVMINGSPRITEFISATQLAASLVDEDVAAPGDLNVTVRRANGSTSAPFVVRVIDAATPFIESFTPETATAGAASLAMTVRGRNFAPDSVVQIEGVGRPTTYVSATELLVQIPAEDLALPGTVEVVVRNGSGAVSPPVNLTVQLILPEILTMDPTSVAAGDPGFTLTVTGRNFGSSAVININGQPQATRYNATTGALSAIIASGLVASAGPLAITVTDNGATSVAATLNVLPPTVTEVNPSALIAGSEDVTVTVIGTSFLPTSKVSFKGGERATTYVSPTQLTAVIPAGALLETGDYALVVVNTPTAISQPFLLSITSPGSPTIAALSHTTVPAGSGSLTLVVTGTNFLPGATIRVNGSSRTTTFVSTTELRTVLDANDLRNPGTLQISVANATGAPTGSLTLTVVEPVSGPRRRAVRH